MLFLNFFSLLTSTSIQKFTYLELNSCPNSQLDQWLNWTHGMEKKQALILINSLWQAKVYKLKRRGKKVRAPTVLKFFFIYSRVEIIPKVCYDTVEVLQTKDTTNRTLECCGMQVLGAMQVKLIMYSLILTNLFLRWDPKAGANPVENRRLASTFKAT